VLIGKGSVRFFLSGPDPLFFKEFIMKIDPKTGERIVGKEAKKISEANTAKEEKKK
jgi:hypothetical protein